MKITKIINAGVLIEGANSKVIVDGLVDKEINLWEALSASEIEKMKSENSIYENIDLLIITHEHEDHFSKDLTCEFLKIHKNTKLFTTKKVHELIKSSNLWEAKLDKQIISTTPSYRTMAFIVINGVKITYTHLIHDGEEYENVNQLCIAVEIDGEKVLHLADAAPVKENFEKLPLVKDIDIALLNFPFVTTSFGLSMIRNYIQPKEIYILHLPKSNLDIWDVPTIINKNASRINSKIILQK